MLLVAILFDNLQLHLQIGLEECLLLSASGQGLTARCVYNRTPLAIPAPSVEPGSFAVAFRKAGRSESMDNHLSEHTVFDAAQDAFDIAPAQGLRDDIHGPFPVQPRNR